MAAVVEGRESGNANGMGSAREGSPFAEENRTEAEARTRDPAESERVRLFFWWIVERARMWLT